VILDVIYNHSGNNWFYRDEQTGAPRDTEAYRFSPPYPIAGWRSAAGECIPQAITLDDGVWPIEFQNPEFYTRAGSIGHWGLAGWEDPMNAKVEFRRGDFYDLKDLELDNHELAIRALATVYQYWIAVTDCDGFRVDAVKHVSVEASRKFCTAIHEYAQSIGKDNFFLTGEITDGGIAPGYVDVFGRNLDAILGIIAYSNLLGAFAKGLVPAYQFFYAYDESTYQGSMRQLGKFIVHVLDDHDMSARAKKQRFAAYGSAPSVYRQAAHVVGVQLMSPGIPAIYYGTEQAFDGNEDYHDYNVEPKRFAEDRYVREAMFGGGFGAFGTTGCHFFNPNHPTYLRIAAIARIRNRTDAIGKTICRGRLYPRETSIVGAPFAIPGEGELVAWSQILFHNEVLVAINTHNGTERGAEVTVDAILHPDGSTMTYLYRSDWSDDELRNPPFSSISSRPGWRFSRKLRIWKRFLGGAGCISQPARGHWQLRRSVVRAHVPDRSSLPRGRECSANCG
jgi:hypothetical protein